MTTSKDALAPNRFDEVIQGMNLLWNNHFEESEKLFSSKRAQNPRYALHHAESVFLKSFITADVNDTAAAMDRLKETKEMAEIHVKAYEKGHYPGDETKKIVDQVVLVNLLLDAKIVLGDALYMTAILQMTRDAKIKGAFNLRRSWKVFESALKDSRSKTVEIHPELSKCIQFGAGFFLFAISIIPSKFLKFVELAGFKADREGGMHFIRENHKSGGIRAPFATMALLFNNLILPRGLANAQTYLTEADELVKSSLEKYPNGSFFHVMGSHSARKQCNVDLGIKFLETALSNCKNLPKEPLIYKFELANCYCMKLEWQKAAEQFAPLIKAEKFQVRYLAALQLAACNIMTGQREKAFDLLNATQNFGGKKTSLDSIIQRQAKRYLANGAHFSAFELLYLRRDLAKMIPIIPKVLGILEETAAKIKANEKKPLPPPKQAGKFDKISKLGTKTLGLLKKKEASDYTFDDRAAYLLLKGSMLKSLNKVEESLPCFQEVIEMQDVLVEKLYVPYCCYELGESFYMLGKLKEATEFMNKCGKFSGYDWEDPLRIRLRVTADQLKRGETPHAPPSLDALAAMIGETKIDDDEQEPDDAEDNEPEFQEEEK